MPNSATARLARALRSGDWLTPVRLRRHAILVGALPLLAAAALWAGGNGLHDRLGRLVGSDFGGVWVAGRAVLAGAPALPYDNALHAAAQAAAFGPSDGFLPWPYPPFFLAPAAALALLPYLAAFAVDQGATLLLYAGAVRAVAAGSRLPARATLAAALAFPAVTVNLLHGQTGFLCAALLAGGVLAAPRRPVLAGVLFGLLAFKPQFGLAVPVALLAGRHWRALAAAALTVAAMAAATLAALGPAPWRAFLGALPFTRRVILEAGGLESYKLQSAFAAVRLLGGSVAAAYGAQCLAAAAALGGVAWLWAGRADPRLKLAGLAAASLLATPYLLDYDLAVLGPALVALAAVGVEAGFAPYARTVLALAWAAPLFARPAAFALSLPLGVLSLVGLGAVVLMQAGFAQAGSAQARGRTVTVRPPPEPAGRVA